MIMEYSPGLATRFVGVLFATCVFLSAAFCQELPRCGANEFQSSYFNHQWSAESLADLVAESRDPLPMNTGTSDAQIRSTLKRQESTLNSAKLPSDFHPQPPWEWSGDFSHAQLSGQDLRYVSFIGADLTASYFFESNLNHADAQSRILYAGTGANLHPMCYVTTLFNGAWFLKTKLLGAELGESDMAHAVFEPDTLPDARSIARAQNLQLLTFVTDPTALMQLRKSFQDSGFGEQVRQVTYALRFRENEIEWLSCCPSCQPAWPLNTISPLFFGAHVWSRGRELWSQRQVGEIAKHCLIYAANRVGLDWTCQYGMNTLRPVRIGIAIWFICSIIFLGFIHHPGSSGLYLIRAEGITLDGEAAKNAAQIRPETAQGWRAKLRGELVLIRQAMLFSLMNGVNLGFKEIDLGRWLRLLPRREMDIKAVGWARTVAGIQALSTLYLVALW